MCHVRQILLWQGNSLLAGEYTVDVIYFDLSKVFDKVSCDILFDELW